jgi:hypothetical protein
MRGATSLARWALTAGLATSLSVLSAQDAGFSKDFKVRLGYAPSTKDHLANSMTSFGLNLEQGIGAGRIGLELGYLYKSGNTYVTTPSTAKLPATFLAMDPSKSHETKRNGLEGFTVRLSFNQAFAEGWRWQAGLQLGGQFKHEYVGDAQSANWLNWGSPAPANSWRDLYNATPTKGGLNPSPYVGATWKIDDSSSLEFNVLLLNYKALEYNHYAGTASSYDPGGQGAGGSGSPYLGPVSSMNAAWPSDSLSSTSRLVPHLELGYVFRF